MPIAQVGTHTVQGGKNARPLEDLMDRYELIVSNNTDYLTCL